MTSSSLQKYVDAFSFQVRAESDEFFWFRLVREPDRDLITDFSPGAFPREELGPLLARCYEVLDLVPQGNLVFQNILADKAGSTAVDEVRSMYLDAATHLLRLYGADSVDSCVEEGDGKVDLVVRARVG